MAAEEDFSDASITTSTEKRPIYVAATKQHVGKTSTSLALMSGLQKRFDAVGFMKPVGQVYLPVWEDDLGREIQADKDVVVMRQHFGLDPLPYRYMSPVLIPKGYTRNYLDGKISEDKHEELVREAYENVARSSDVVLCEGTGHAAVGSIVGASNARVASWLGAEMVLVANGGLGSAFDELELNHVLCQHHNVPIAGVIINKVHRDKYEQTKHYIEKALDKHWGVPLLGCIPDRPFLGCPALKDLERLFGCKLLSGNDQRLRHYTVKDLNLVATSLDVFLKNLRKKPARTLYVCHVSREDILLGFLAEYQRRQYRSEPFEAALIVCGRPDRYSLDPQVLDMISQTKDAPPILQAPYTSREVMELIHNYTPKLNMDDADRVSTTVAHYEPYIDFDLLLERTGNMPSDKKTAAIAM
jgi:BioD-like phosphotransacetylase family protein